MANGIDLSKIRTQSQILGNIDGSGNGFRDFISKLTLANDGINGNTIDTTDIELLVQAYLDPTSLELSNLYIYLDFILRAISVEALLEVDNDTNYKSNLQNALHISEQKLQSLIDTIFNYHGSNVQKDRRGSTFATGSALFTSTIAPASDILIPAGTSISTVASSTTPAIVYQTTSSVTMFQAQASSYLNPITGLYGILAPVKAALAGADGNQIAGSVDVLISQIGGISGVSNPSKIQGGYDSEPNILYAPRIISASFGISNSSKTGLSNTSLQQQNVSDASIIGAGNSLMLRDGGAGGKVDIYVQTNNDDLQQVTNESHNYIGASSYLMSNQPVEPKLSIIVKAFNSAGVQIGSAMTLTTHYSFSKDRDVFPNYREWSYIAQDKITVSAGQAVQIGIDYPTISTIRISYSYDRRILLIQNGFNTDDGHDLSCDILIRKSKSAIFNMSIQAKLITGFSVSDVQNSISTIISSIFSIGLKILGKNASIAIAIAAIQDAGSSIGVKEIETITFTLSDGNDSLASTSAVIDGYGNATIKENQFYQLGTVIVTSV